MAWFSAHKLGWNSLPRLFPFFGFPMGYKNCAYLFSAILMSPENPSGLRIAPPEAPVTGYMFGKGVYFADMFSKSANYCFASSNAPAGVLLLCEVAFVLFPFS